MSTSTTNPSHPHPHPLPSLHTDTEWAAGEPSSTLSTIDILSIGPLHPYLPRCTVEVYPIHADPGTSGMPSPATSSRSALPFLGACISAGQGCIVTGDFLQLAYAHSPSSLEIEPIDPTDPEMRLDIFVQDPWRRDPHVIQVGAISKIPFLLKGRRTSRGAGVGDGDGVEEFLFRVTLPCLVTPEGSSIVPVGPSDAHRGVVMWIGCDTMLGNAHAESINCVEPFTSLFVQQLPGTSDGDGDGDGDENENENEWYVRCDHRWDPEANAYTRVSGGDVRVVSVRGDLDQRFFAAERLWEGESGSDDSASTVMQG